MVYVRIDENDMLNMLMERLAFWTDDDVDTKLFEQYYERMINDGCFNGSEFNVMSIVDNDYVNWFSVISKDEFENYRIDDEEDERIMESYYDEYNNEKYYLIYCG